MTTATGTDDRIILRQSWLGSLAMCPERARQDMLGISQSTESSNTAIGTAVHYGIEQCLITKMETGDPLPKSETICASIEEWVRKEPEIVRWNHKVDECVKIIELNTSVWWDEVMPDIDPISVEQDTTDIFDKKQVVRTKEDTDFTGTTQGDTIIHDSILENIEPDFIYYDTMEAKREADSIDAYLKYWYEVLDTNSDGEIDDNIINYDMGCGGEVHDSIIEWLEE